MAGSSTFVVFIIYTPIVTTFDPEGIKKVFSSYEVQKHVGTYNHAISYGGQRFLGLGLLTTPDYKRWKPRRTRYNPYFTKSETEKRLIPVANQLVDDLVKSLTPDSSASSKNVEISSLLDKYALDTVSKVMFGCIFPIKSKDELSLKNAKVDEGSIYSLLFYVLRGLQAMIDTYFVFNTLPLKFSSELTGYKEAARALREIGHQRVQEMIAAAKKGEVSDDIISCVIKKFENEGGPVPQDLVDDFANFLTNCQVGGAEIVFTFILVHQHPQVYDRVLEEIEEVLGARDFVTAEDLGKLKYLDQVIHESMRMYSPANSVSRQIPKGGMEVSGIHIPQGTIFILSQSAMNYEDKYFENPEQFNPDRFAPDKKRPNPGVFFPFGYGYRDCLGMHFAMMESKIVLARLLQKFKFQIPPNYKIESEIITTQRLEGKLNCVCSPRK